MFPLDKLSNYAKVMPTAKQIIVKHAPNRSLTALIILKHISSKAHCVYNVI